MLTVAAQGGESDAFDSLVTLLQDLAVGYAFSLLGDWHLAHDAAQEAFIETHVRLNGLRNPDQFVAYLRQILFKQCDRIKRRKSVPFCGGEEADNVLSPDLMPPQWSERREQEAQIRGEIVLLPDAQREVVILFYIGECSHREVAQFLGVPVSTVKKRLYDARQKLKRRLLTMLQDDLNSERPSNNPNFALNVRRFTAEFSESVSSGESLVRSLLNAANKQSDADFAAAIRQIQRDVSGDGKSGLTLSQAMGNYPEFFSADYVATIKHGEINGTLKMALENLVDK